MDSHHYNEVNQTTCRGSNVKKYLGGENQTIEFIIQIYYFIYFKIISLLCWNTYLAQY